MTEVHFDEPEDAEAFLVALSERGISATMLVDLFAGEDDSADAARLLEVEPNVDVAVLAQEYGGWVASARPDAPPLDLPDLPDLPAGPRTSRRSR